MFAETVAGVPDRGQNLLEQWVHLAAFDQLPAHLNDLNGMFHAYRAYLLTRSATPARPQGLGTDDSPD